MRRPFTRVSPSTTLWLVAAMLLALAAAAHASDVTSPGGEPVTTATATIGDFVWDDLNGNGIQDAGEPGVGGVMVFLTDQDHNFITELPTDGNGHYSFPGLALGTYHVGIKAPCDFTLTNVGGNRAVDSNVSNAAVDLTGDDFTIDFGMRCTPEQNSCLCNLRYPDHSNDPRSSVLFNESTVLKGFDPDPATCASSGSTIKLWYSDEHAMTLGVRQVVIKNPGGSVNTYNKTIAASPKTPTSVSDPDIGANDPTGDQSGNDVAAGGGRPLWPALFITDLTVNGPDSRAGDWQQGGTGIKPHKVYGLWKAAVRTVDKTHVPTTVKVVCDPDPAKNGWNLGPGADIPPGGFASLKNEGYGAECAWNVDDLGLTPGHSYRLQFMVHDGDQNKAGGDVGEACTTLNLVLPQVVADGSGASQSKSTVAPVADAVGPGTVFGRPVPNPFRNTTRFAYKIDGAAKPVNIAVFDLSGRRVRSLVSGVQESGRYETSWDGHGDDGARQSKGVYFLHARIGDAATTVQIMYLQ